ncbi:MAG: hypothetical protein ACD_75C02062G0005 [uncultured bacterium]|nr:MAG: hypothetical protein ACD_75C02062G0005 [uncultured bacterium]
MRNEERGEKSFARRPRMTNSVIEYFFLNCTPSQVTFRKAGICFEHKKRGQSDEFQIDLVIRSFALLDTTINLENVLSYHPMILMIAPPRH